MNTQKRKVISTAIFAITICGFSAIVVAILQLIGVLPSAPPVFRRFFLGLRRQLLIALHQTTSNHSPLFITIALYSEMAAKFIFILCFFLIIFGAAFVLCCTYLRRLPARYYLFTWIQSVLP